MDKRYVRSFTGILQLVVGLLQHEQVDQSKGIYIGLAGQREVLGVVFELQQGATHLRGHVLWRADLEVRFLGGHFGGTKVSQLHYFFVRDAKVQGWSNKKLKKNKLLIYLGCG